MNGQVADPALREHRQPSARGRAAVEPSAGNRCTDDLAPTSHEFRVPAGAGTLPLTITLVYAQGGSSRTLMLE